VSDGGPSLEQAPHTAALSFTYSTPEQARRIERSVRPELDRIADDRSRASVARDADTLTVTVRATDLVALRAGTNTWVRLVDVAETVSDLAA
jgi:KEOPS complex subunit Pcc1